MRNSRKKVRQDAIRYYSAMLKELRGELHKRTMDSNNLLKRYVEAYEKEVKRVKYVSYYKDLIKNSKNKDVVLFGNFRSDNQVRYEFLAFLEELCRLDTKLCVGIDWIPYNKRKLLENYLAGRISKRNFVKDLCGGYKVEPRFLKSYLEVIDFLKREKIPAIPVDFGSVSGRNIYKKDETTAKRLASFYSAKDASKLVVLVPDTWIAKEHLPYQLLKYLARIGLTPKILRVFSGSDRLFLKLAGDFKEDKVSMVCSSSNTYVFNLVHPIARYRSFFNYLDEEDETGDFRDREEGFKEVLSLINNKFGLKVDLRSLKYRLCTNFEVGFIESILSSEFFSEDQKRSIIDYVSRGESYFIPYDQTIYLSSLSKIHAAEEAGHYLRYIVAGLERPKSLEDRFYSSVINEALAFVASKLVVPSRAPIKRGMIKNVMKTDLTEDEREAIMVHSLGYSLGDVLFRKFRNKRLSKRRIKDIFSKQFKQKGQAKKYYSFLLKLVEK